MFWGKIWKTNQILRENLQFLFVLNMYVRICIQVFEFVLKNCVKQQFLNCQIILIMNLFFKWIGVGAFSLKKCSIEIHILDIHSKFSKQSNRTKDVLMFWHSGYFFFNYILRTEVKCIFSNFRVPWNRFHCNSS